MKINLGAGPNWKHDGWHVLDYKVEKNDKFRIKGDLNKINLKNKSCDVVFISHTLEHIPHIQIQRVLTEINRIMKAGATIRILVPNIEVIAKAYVKKDKKFFKKALDEDHSIRTDLGFGGMLMNFIVSPGQDTILIDRNLKKFIAGYAHLYAYDFSMMKILLKKCGFKNITKKKFCDSKIKDFKIPCHIYGKSSKYHNLNNKFYAKNNLIHEYKNGKYRINFKFTGFDKDPVTSLIIEAKKDRYKKISKLNDINDSNKNYNNYAFSLLSNKNVKTSLSRKKIKF
tara:strand:+ start:8086 stop:8937 length:852 start_codon:yes stop_codon:yes gene_type:complete